MQERERELYPPPRQYQAEEMDEVACLGWVAGWDFDRGMAGERCPVLVVRLGFFQAQETGKGLDCFPDTVHQLHRVACSIMDRGQVPVVFGARDYYDVSEVDAREFLQALPVKAEIMAQPVARHSVPTSEVAGVPPAHQVTERITAGNHGHIRWDRAEAGSTFP